MTSTGSFYMKAFSSFSLPLHETSSFHTFYVKSESALLWCCDRVCWRERQGAHFRHIPFLQTQTASFTGLVVSLSCVQHESKSPQWKATCNPPDLEACQIRTVSALSTYLVGHKCRRVVYNYVFGVCNSPVCRDTLWTIGLMYPHHTGFRIILKVQLIIAYIKTGCIT